MDNLEVAWGSGFIDGDGTFDRRQRWRAVSTRREHLDRLQVVFGGKVYALGPRPSDLHNDQFEWTLSTKRHGPDIGLILAGLSGHRREQLIGYGFTLSEVKPFTPEEELAWAAGWIDAEGHVCGTGASLSTNLIGVQVHTDEPLRRLQALFGGSINWHPNKWNGSHRWGVYGKAADVAITQLSPYLSPYRLAQVQAHYARQAQVRHRE